MDEQPAPGERPDAACAPEPATAPAADHGDDRVATGAPLPVDAAWQSHLLDLLPDGLLLVGADGEIAYRNAAAVACIEEQGHELPREACALALQLFARGGPRRASRAPPSRQLAAGMVRFRLDATLAPALPLGGPAVLVTITRVAPPLPSAATLHQLFQLTKREASVALLLAEGRSNAAISRRLGISVCTVRHYTETVLLKLDVPSRAAVAAALLGIYERTDEHPLPAGRRATHAPLAD